MSRGPEGKVKDAVRKILETTGAYWFMPAMGAFGRSGIPDVIACHKGHFIGIECKAGKGKTTTLQDRELANINNTGGTALIINETNLQLLKDTLDKL
jgi:Holliday junction resolvase